MQRPATAAYAIRPCCANCRWSPPWSPQWAVRAATQLPPSPTPWYAPKDQSKCSINASQARPLIVEWPSADRLELESKARQGLIAVRSSGCDIEPLYNCVLPAKYAYVGGTPKEDELDIDNQDDLYANLPVGAAKLEGRLEHSGKLIVKMSMIGRYESQRASVRADELQGDCVGATHFISGVTLGAFEFYGMARPRWGLESVPGARARVPVPRPSTRASATTAGRTRARKPPAATSRLPRVAAPSFASRSSHWAQRRRSRRRARAVLNGTVPTAWPASQPPPLHRRLLSCPRPSRRLRLGRRAHRGSYSHKARRARIQYRHCPPCGSSHPRAIRSSPPSRRLATDGEAGCEELVQTTPGSAHVHLILDGRLYKPIYDPSSPVRLSGSDRGHPDSGAGTCWSRSLHEPTTRASRHWRGGDPPVLDRSAGAAAIDPTRPLLIYSRPKGDYRGDMANHVLVDFQLANATLSARRRPRAHCSHGPRR